MRDVVRSAIAALGFLTVAPVGRRAAIADADLRRGVLLFPLVGALVGGLMAITGWGASMLLPSTVAGAVAVAIGAGITGAIHLDALGDTADGVGAALAGHDPREAMADPRLGTFGVVAVALDLLLRVAVVSALLGSGRFPWAIVAAGSLGRTSVLALSAALPYAGSDEAPGSWTRSLQRRRCLAGIAIGVGIAFLAAGLPAAAMTAMAAIVCVAISRWSSRHLAGMRGDTFGAAVELTETCALVAALATA